MSGRLIITPHNPDLILQQEVVIKDSLITSFNQPPKTQASIIHLYKEQLVQENAFWSFTPSWLKDLNSAPYLLRAENLHSSPMYSQSFAQHRCLLIVSGYFVWLKLSRGKHPFAVRLPQNKPFILAGLSTSYQAAPNSNYLTFGLISQEADPWLQQLSQRIPVKLKPEQALKWLNTKTSLEELKLLLETQDQELEAYPVSSLVNNPDNQSDQVIRPLAARLTRPQH